MAETKKTNARGAPKKEPPRAEEILRMVRETKKSGETDKATGTQAVLQKIVSDKEAVKMVAEGETALVGIQPVPPETQNETKEEAELRKKLVQMRRDAEERDAMRRAHLTGYQYVDLRKVPIVIDALRLIPEKAARASKVAAIELRGAEVALAAYDPVSKETKAVTEDLAAKKYTAKLFTASLSSLEQAWSFYRFITEGAKEITGKVEIARIEELTEHLKTFPAVQEEIKKTNFRKLGATNLLEIILAGALVSRASDIHFEAEEKHARIRYRLDGVLHDLFSALPARNYEALISRVKLLSGLKLNVHSEPQDGRFTIGLKQKEVEVRVSIIPSEFGETIVMRMLDPEAIKMKLEDLGMRPDDLALVNEELRRPFGLILNTGPTGSGKTTTLYAFLQKMVAPEIKIITIEDPIEYRIEGIEQTQVDPDAGYTFGKGLRAIVRQDPDTILVGEIRDLETADIALQASLTGHMVFSTLHTNDAAGAVPRLIDLGVKPATVGTALTLVIAQRLVRKLCEVCRKPAKVPPDLEGKIKTFFGHLPKRVDRSPYEKRHVFEAGAGCPSCNNFGYRGRRAIFEFFRGGQELEEFVLKEASYAALKKLAEKQEMVTMQQDGVLKVLSGITTFEEVESVTGPIVW